MDGARPVAEIGISWWRDRGRLKVGGAAYAAYREGLASGAYILSAGGSVLARAEKPSALRRFFTIEHAGRRYTLQAKHALGRAFSLLEDSGEAGSIEPEGIFTRRARANVPDELPLPVRVFIIWLVLIMWKRESDSAGPPGEAGGAGWA